MKNLIYKEVTFSIHKFFFIFPVLLALLLFIPNWIFTLVFMYFFWISVSQVCSAYIAQSDYTFLSMLPVSKKDIVTSKIYAFIVLELVHILTAVIFGIIHNLIYGSWNFFLDINPFFFGLAFATYGLFNIVFLPLYYKTAYRFGKPVIYGVVATFLFVGFFEYANFGIPLVRDFMQSSNLLIQYASLAFGIMVFVVLSILSIKRSVFNFENIK